MTRPDARWGHAARVALAATLVVAAVAALLTVVVNASILDRLNRDIDTRLRADLAAVATGGTAEGDEDDAPVFVWRVAPDGSVTALTVGAPELPTVAWTTGTSTVATPGGNFRFAATPSRGGWLVAGESATRVHDSSADVLLVELALGSLLLLVTFTGSFVIGLRASAPIEQVRRRQAEFTADASHELRTPLSVIEAEVDLALARPRRVDDYEATLRRVAAESGRLRSIVDDLLWLARAEAPPPGSAHTDPVDLSAVVDATIGRFSAVAQAGSVSLTARTAPHGGTRVRGDAEAIDRLVGVLVDNACRHAGSGGAVEVEVAATGGRVVLTVDDTGPGIPVEHRELVFDRFHRADDSPGGTGLGLAIADTVVRNTGGTWTVGTAPLGGARFQVSWRPAPRSSSTSSDRPPGPPGDRAPDSAALGTA